MSFAQLAKTFLQETFAESPVMATGLGIDGYEDQLDDLSEAAFERRRRRTTDWIGQFQAVDPGSLGHDDAIDRDLLLSTLRGQQILADWEMWRRQPDLYLNPGLYGVFTLFLHGLKPEAELVQAAAARLRQIPRILEDGRRNLAADLAPVLYLRRARGQARAGATYTRTLLPQQVADPLLRANLAEAGEVAGAALEEFARFLGELSERAHGEWAIGEERYSSLLGERELLGVDARGLRERGQREYERLAEELCRYARDLAGTDDWPEVLRQLNLDHPRTPEEMRVHYAEWTERARQFLRDNRLVSFPEGEECLVAPSPPFQRPVLAVASYQSPPPFSTSMRGHFFVPYPPDGAPEDEVQKRLENNSFASIPTTAAHEAYPGHHWHLVMAKGHPSAVRRTFRTPYFSEGWALYAEQMMREQGFFTDPRHEMSQFEAMLFRAARIVVDTSLHRGDMTFDEAVDFMRTRANLPQPTAEAEVSRYCSWPTQAAAYLTGCLEILRIRERFLREKGLSGVDGLRTFHDTLARSGGLPMALAERAALG